MRSLAELGVLLLGLGFIGFGLWLLFPHDFDDAVEEYFKPLTDLWRALWRD